MPDGERLVAWLREGANELEHAHNVLDRYDVPRKADNGTPLTLALRIAVALDAGGRGMSETRTEYRVVDRFGHPPQIPGNRKIAHPVTSPSMAGFRAAYLDSYRSGRSIVAPHRVQVRVDVGPWEDVTSDE